MDFEISGLDEFQRRLNKFGNNIKELKNTNEIGFDELFNAKFMAKYTNLSSMNSFLEYLGIHNKEDFKKFPESKLDVEVAKHTSFSSWTEMLQTATEEYLGNRLTL